jgi:hypothetical protein
MSDHEIDSAQTPEAPAEQQRPVYRGPRWYRARVSRLGPFYGLALPGITGLIAIAALVFGQGRAAAVLALLTGVVAAPGLLVVGAPIADQGTYPLAIAGSVPFWLLLGWVASRRAARHPITAWREFWMEMGLLYIAVGIGAVSGVLIAAVRLGERLL